MSFLSGSAGLNLFQATWLVSASSKQPIWSLSLFFQLGLSESHSQQLNLFPLGKRGLVNVAILGDLLKLF